MTKQKALNYNQFMPIPSTEKPTPTALVEQPFPIKAIRWILALWMILGALRFGRILKDYELIIELVSPFLFAYLLLSGLIWALLGLPVLWGLAHRAPWTPLALKITAALYPGLYWFDRLCLWQDLKAYQNWPFMLLLMIAWFGLVFLGLRAIRPETVL